LHPAPIQLAFGKDHGRLGDVLLPDRGAGVSRALSRAERRTGTIDRSLCLCRIVASAKAFEPGLETRSALVRRCILTLCGRGNEGGKA
jgi:hypothetical protein